LFVVAISISAVWCTRN